MSQDIDFIMPSSKKIERPNKEVKAVKQQEKKKHPTKSFQIQKSFIPQQISQVHQQLRPEIDSLKKFIKLKKQKQRRQKQQKAEGKSIKNETEVSEDKKQQTIKYKIDESGHLRDEQGNLIFVKNQTTQLKINQKKQQQHQSKQLNKKQKIKFHERLSRSFLDRNLVISGVKKRLRRSMLGLQFLEQGSYQPYSSRKAKEQVNDLDEIAKKQTQSDTKIIRKRFKSKLQFSRQVPNYQWWDLQIVNEQILKNEIEKEKQKNQKINFETVLNIEKLNNQVVFQKVGDEAKRQKQYKIPVYLTKDERKKLKRKRKREKLIEKNDMVRLGLIEPQKPKLKISNMAIVMKDQFIIDPSRVEAEAKKQQDERLNKHLQSNAERKLSKSQKKQKVIRKLKKDSSKQYRRIVFKLNKLQDRSQIFKVNVNAKQLLLNGFVITPTEYHSQPVIVMAEGGAKAIRFFKNLMVNRIKWNQNDDNQCKIIWEGEIENSKLGKWRTIQVGDESETLRALTERGVQNFIQYFT